MIFSKAFRLPFSRLLQRKAFFVFDKKKNRKIFLLFPEERHNY
jgi:hypothetical protein